jgi:hypothetical protein
MTHIFTAQIWVGLWVRKIYHRNMIVGERPVSKLNAARMIRTARNRGRRCSRYESATSSGDCVPPGALRLSPLVAKAADEQRLADGEAGIPRRTPARTLPAGSPVTGFGVDLPAVRLTVWLAGFRPWNQRLGYGGPNVSQLEHIAAWVSRLDALRKVACAGEPDEISLAVLLGSHRHHGTQRSSSASGQVTCDGGNNQDQQDGAGKCERICRRHTIYQARQ